MAHIFRPATQADRVGVAAAVIEFGESFAEAGPDANRIDGNGVKAEAALSAFMLQILDAILERDCDSTARIRLCVCDSAREKVYTVAPGIDWADAREEAELLQRARMFELQVAKNIPIAMEIINQAVAVIARGNPELEQDEAATAISGQIDMKALNRAADLIGGRLTKGVLSTDGDGWPELDPDFHDDLHAIFEVLKQVHPQLSGCKMHLADRRLSETFILLPVADRIGRQELATARHAIADATRLISEPAVSSGQAYGIHRAMVLDRADREKWHAQAVAARHELRGFPGLLDGLSETAAAQLTAWIEQGEPFSTRFGRSAPARTVAFVEELRARFGEESLAHAPAAFYSDGQKAMRATRQLVDALKAATPARQADPGP